MNHSLVNNLSVILEHPINLGKGIGFEDILSAPVGSTRRPQQPIVTTKAMPKMSHEHKRCHLVDDTLRPPLVQPNATTPTHHAHTTSLTVLASQDLLRSLLPGLQADAVAALRATCRDARAAIDAVVLDIIETAERAAALYVTPRFVEALQLAKEHHVHICWVLTESLAGIVASERFDSIVANAYHLLQAHCTRVEKQRISKSLRYAARHPRLSMRARCVVLHLAVRLGMFSEKPIALHELLEAAERAISGITRVDVPQGGGVGVAAGSGCGGAVVHRAASGSPACEAAPAATAAAASATLPPGPPTATLRRLSHHAAASTAAAVAYTTTIVNASAVTAPGSAEMAAAHYTLAGFYTYHHRRDDIGDTLGQATCHLSRALEIQISLLGDRHVSTLCSQLLRAQVLLLESGPMLADCGELLETQLALCKEVLSIEHPLAAKMLAVKARLQMKLGHEKQAEELQYVVLGMRLAALGEDHEDSHRSAIDIYSRRRSTYQRTQHLAPGEPVRNNPSFEPLAGAVRLCFSMLRGALLRPDGADGFLLSKSLQAMSDISFKDILWLSTMGAWARDETLALLHEAAATVALVPRSASDDNGAVAAELARLPEQLRRVAAKVVDSAEWPLAREDSATHGPHGLFLTG